MVFCERQCITPHAGLDPPIGSGLCSPAMGHWFRLGDLELCVASDGVIRQDAGATFGLVPRVMWQRYTPDLDDKNRIPVGNNSLLVRSAGKTVLLDTGV